MALPDAPYQGFRARPSTPGFLELYILKQGKRWSFAHLFLIILKGFLRYCKPVVTIEERKVLSERRL